MNAEKIEVPGGTLAAAWRVVSPYWLSRRNWTAWLLVIAMVAGSTLTTLAQLASTVWSKNMVDAFTTYNLPRLIWLSGVFLLLGGALAVTAVADYFLNEWLTIRWRTWLTQHFLGQWLSGHTFYRIERDHLLDNPDQRISEDLGQLIQYSLGLTLGLYGTLFRLVTFSSVLWSKAGTLDFSLHGRAWSIPGYMFWCALLFSVIQFWFIHLVGKPLMRVNFLKQRVEGDFRFGMAGIRAHPEQIAMYNGGPAELRRMEQAFEPVRRNMWQVLWVQLRFDAMRHFVESLAQPLPILLAAPGYFSRAMTFGDVTQVGTSFGMTVSQFSWFVRAYQEFQMFRVVVARLYALQLAAQSAQPSSGSVLYTRGPQSEVATCDLTLRTPQDRKLIGPVSLRVKAGERWIIQGKSGVGKSTLMRALAGIWPYGEGTVRVPANGRVRFLPQAAYLPTGALKTALCYPSDPADCNDQVCRQALRDVRLAAYAERLEEVDRWSERLSKGEQQRLALAGALVQQPDFLFLDEATGALDSETEREVYTAVLERLPNTAIVHVSHHAELKRFHDHVFNISEVEAMPPAAGATS